MPNRLIKESICTSEDLDKLSHGAEILFYRLIVQADDYGCYYGNPSIVKSRCFPLKSDELHSNEIDAWLDELANAGIIIRYTAEDGRDYIQFMKWAKHQRVRQTEHKYPQYNADCCQLKSSCRSLPQLAADCGRLRPNPIQSNPESNPIRIQSNPDDNNDFDLFWEAYPKKSGDIRQAFFEWEGAIQNGASPEEIIEAVKRQSEQKETRFFPSAEKWLRNKGWTEKPETERPKKRMTTFLDIGDAQRGMEQGHDG